MFTGLVQDLGTVAAVDATGDGVRLRLRTSLAGEIGEGDSVAVNGVCLTATEVTGDAFAADVMHESLRRSSLGDAAREGERVNLELSLRASDRLGGHIVQGHVDAVGTVSGVRDDGFSRVVTIDAPAGVLRYVVEKGSIAVNGVSLTVSAISGDAFEVSLIPETLQATTLGRLEVGDSVNVETDILARHVERMLRLDAHRSLPSSLAEPAASPTGSLA